MNERDIDERIRAALAARARQITAAPGTTSLSLSRAGSASSRPHSAHRWLAPMLAAAAVLLVALTAATVVHFRTSADRNGPATKLGGVPTGSPTPMGTPTGPASSAAPTGPASTGPASHPVTATAVHVRLLETDGATYGVGMPIVVFLSASITDASAFVHAAVVTVDGQPAGGAWYFESSTQISGYPLEAHYRPPGYWPAHSTIHLDLPVDGLSAGGGASFDDSVALSMSIGDSHVSSVDGQTLIMTVRSNGQLVKTIPVSLGPAATPAYNGTTVVMDKDNPEHMVGPGYDEEVPWSVRLTRSGESIQAAPWSSPIARASLPNACTNLSTADAEWFYEFSQLGDIVTYAGTAGPTMPAWDGLGDWNIAWPQWQAGGLLATS